MVHSSCGRFKKHLSHNNRAQQKAPHNSTDIITTRRNTEIVSSHGKKPQKAPIGGICYPYLPQQLRNTNAGKG